VLVVISKTSAVLGGCGHIHMSNQVSQSSGNGAGWTKLGPGIVSFWSIRPVLVSDPTHQF
jgi:hypothetical protein